MLLDYPAKWSCCDSGFVTLLADSESRVPWYRDTVFSCRMRGFMTITNKHQHFCICVCVCFCVRVRAASLVRLINSAPVISLLFEAPYIIASPRRLVLWSDSTKRISNEMIRLCVFAAHSCVCVCASSCVCVCMREMQKNIFIKEKINTGWMMPFKWTKRTRRRTLH